ncbi:MAG: FAD-binding oxidoreductase [Verrucomicrobiota bacterium]
MTDLPVSLLSGWGRYTPVSCRVANPASRSALLSLISESSGQNIIARGMGRSYGDSAVREGGVVVEQEFLNRFLSFDEQTGLLHCEAGVTLEQIIDFALPRGWFLPTTPGTKFVTVGGAIAADVHGKNHHRDGCFGAWIRELTLLLSDGRAVTCSPEQDPEAFWATIGGMGLTGFIQDARIQLRPCQSAWYHVSYRRCADLDAVLSTLAETDAKYRYSVGWIDCLAKGSRLGRTVLMLANDPDPADLPASLRNSPLSAPRARHLTVPFDFPSWALNPASVMLFNRAYYLRQQNRDSLEHYDKFFYPLDSINHWNRIYGRRGFIQYQALFPDATAPEGLRCVLETLSSYGLASFLAVIKRSGPSNPSPLSFLFKGYTLALDIPNVGPRLLEMTRKLDEILLARGGRLYLAKDSVMDAATFSAMYPRKAEFLSVKKRLDPENRFVSDQARRLGLVP